jgi:hypothetical protein
LALEVSFKVAASGIKQAIPGQRGSEVMYLIFMVVGGVLSCVGMSRIDDLQDGLDSETQEGGTSQVGGTTRRERSASASGASSATATAAPRGTAAGVSAKLVYSKAAGAMRLLWHNKKMALVLPTQFAFSVVASFLGSWITPNVLTKVVGNEKIGLFLGEWARSVASVLSEWARSVASVLSEWARRVASVLSEWARSVASVLSEWARGVAGVLSEWARSVAGVLSEWARSVASVLNLYKY